VTIGNFIQHLILCSCQRYASCPWHDVRSPPPPNRCMLPPPPGASTGLHHDFHDNLYVLLRGCKRFRLFPPSSAPDMYLPSRLTHIHHNGRIVYDGQGDINPDGSGAGGPAAPPAGQALH